VRHRRAYDKQTMYVLVHKAYADFVCISIMGIYNDLKSIKESKYLLKHLEKRAKEFDIVPYELDDSLGSPREHDEPNDEDEDEADEDEYFVYRIPDSKFCDITVYNNLESSSEQLPIFSFSLKTYKLMMQVKAEDKAKATAKATATVVYTVISARDTCTYVFDNYKNACRKLLMLSECTDSDLEALKNATTDDDINQVMYEAEYVGGKIVKNVINSDDKSDTCVFEYSD
jgi:hypothetical protein